MYGKETDTVLKFDLSNAVAITSLFLPGSSSAQEACAEGSLVVAAGGTKMKVSPSGVDILGDVTVSGNITATGDVNSRGGISLSTHTHAGDSGGSTSTPR